MLTTRRVEESCRGGFRPHRHGGGVEAQEDADLRVLSLGDAAQVTNVIRVELPRLDRNDDLPRLVVAEVKVEAAVDAFVRAFLLLRTASADEAERPPLESFFKFSRMVLFDFFRFLKLFQDFQVKKQK